MAPIAAPTYLTAEAYLELERKAITKNEYVNGETIAMAGASFAHNFITLDTATHFNSQCELLLPHVYRRVKFDNNN